METKEKRLAWLCLKVTEIQPAYPGAFSVAPRVFVPKPTTDRLGRWGGDRFSRSLEKAAKTFPKLKKLTHPQRYPCKQ